jgi:hypothetical protein
LQIDQFKLELLPGLVIYERDDVMRIGFRHFSSPNAAVRLRQATADTRDLSCRFAAAQDKIVAAG